MLGGGRGRESPPPAMRIRGYYPGNFWKFYMPHREAYILYQLPLAKLLVMGEIHTIYCYCIPRSFSTGIHDIVNMFCACVFNVGLFFVCICVCQFVFALLLLLLLLLLKMKRLE